MSIKNAKIRREQIEKFSSFLDLTQKHIEVIKNGHYRIVTGLSVGGDAPKEILKIYRFKRGQKTIHNPKLWETYIVKTGHKWYPSESITEYILNQLGCCLNITMAESRLARINGQIRFLSKLFITSDTQILEHGAQIYAGYLGDKDFVEEVEAKSMARDFFTVTFTYEAIKRIYPYQAEDIFSSFVRMLIFDAIIGNNDRHFYNWGVIQNVKSKHQPYFAPIYDTARAFFWNKPEAWVREMVSQPVKMRAVLERYINKSKPKTGVEKVLNANHFDLIRKLLSTSFPFSREIVHEMLSIQNKERCLSLLDEELRYYLTNERYLLIRECIKLRFEKMIEMVRGDD